MYNEHLHQLATTSKPLTAKVNNCDYPIATTSVRWWDVQYLAANKKSVLEVNVVEAGKIGKQNNLNL